MNIDEIVKSPRKGWIPAFAGMTQSVSNRYSITYCPSREGGNPEKGLNTTYYGTVNIND